MELILRAEKRQIERLSAIESVPRMFLLVRDTHTQYTGVFAHELLLALCWEESQWQNIQQFDGGPAIGYGQLEKDGRRIANQHLTRNPSATESFPFSKAAILAVPEFSMSAISHCLAGLYERLKSRSAVLNAYAGVKARPENRTFPPKWEACANALSGFAKNPLFFTPESVEDALRKARSFPYGGSVYDHIHRRLWPFEELIRSVQRTLEYASRGVDVWNLQESLNQIRLADTTFAGMLPPLKVDGIFGEKTAKRVNEFQAGNGLVADGIVGPKTRASLAEKAARLRV